MRKTRGGVEKENEEEGDLKQRRVRKREREDTEIQESSFATDIKMYTGTCRSDVELKFRRSGKRRKRTS